MAAVQVEGAYPYVPDLGDGTYRNPVLFADYSDPDVVRHGDDFWLTASSFNCTPGLPILHSRDLVNWKIVTYALKNLPLSAYDTPQHGCGVWAPAIRFHAGKFYIFFPTPDDGIFVIWATDPARKWSEPHLLQAGKGLIDPCPLWDDDGKAYLVHAYAGSRAGIKHRLRVVEMAPDASKLLATEKTVFHEPERHPTLEGPKFLKKDGYYYILAPAGGVATGWQLVLRSKSVWGPYEEKIALAQGSTAINGPHQGALVDHANGSWWFLHFQELQPYGRIVHLQPVRWEGGWPLMGENQNALGTGEPVMRHRKPSTGEPVTMPATSDNFAGPELGLQWQWFANHKDSWYSLKARRGCLRLYALPVPKGDLSKAGHLLLKKLPAAAFSVETRITLSAEHVGESAGLVMMGKQYAALALERSAGGVHVICITNAGRRVIATAPETTMDFRVSMQHGGLCHFSYRSAGGSWTIVEPPFQAVEGVWIGAKVGLFAAALEGSISTGYADCAYFRFGKPDAT